MKRATKKELLKACKLDEPVPPGDPRHYDFDNQPLRGQPWRQRVTEVIDLSSEPTTQLVTGLPGSGKSTELEQLRRDLVALDHRVTLADAGAWIRDDAPLFQLAARRLAELRDLREKVFALLTTAAHEADKAGEPLVIILDGIEKRATGDLSGPEEREKYRNHWFGAFLTHARDLRPPVHVVYTVPPFMVRRAAEIGAQYGHELLFLPMIRVFECGDDERKSPVLHRDGLRPCAPPCKSAYPSSTSTTPRRQGGWRCTAAATCAISCAWSSTASIVCPRAARSPGTSPTTRSSRSARPTSRASSSAISPCSSRSIATATSPRSRATDARWTRCSRVT